MKRREFLKNLFFLIIGAITAIFTSGCGGGSGKNVATPSRLKTTINSEGSSQNVEIATGSTVLEVIKSAFPYQKDDETTTINGTSGHWRYVVNGEEPSIYAGNYRLNSNSTIDLYLIS